MTKVLAHFGPEAMQRAKDVTAEVSKRGKGDAYARLADAASLLVTEWLMDEINRGTDVEEWIAAMIRTCGWVLMMAAGQITHNTPGSTIEDDAEAIARFGAQAISDALAFAVSARDGDSTIIESLKGGTA